MQQGPFPHRRLCCPTGSIGTTAPSATLPTRRDFPFRRLYAPAAPDHRTIGVGEGFPSSRAHLLPIPLPLPRRVPRRLHLQVFSAFHGLRRDFSGSAPPCPLAGLASRGCRIRVMLRAGQSLPPKGLSTLRFNAGRFPPTPAACYRASWQLPGPDSHRLADTSLRVDHLNATTSMVITSRTHAAGHTKTGLAAWCR